MIESSTIMDIAKQAARYLPEDDHNAAALACKQLHVAIVTAHTRLRTTLIRSTTRSESLRLWAESVGCPQPYPYWVVIHSLSSAADLNGRLARVMGPPNADDRHPVAVGHPYSASQTPESAFKRKLIRKANLHMPQERLSMGPVTVSGSGSCLGVVSLVVYDSLCPRQRLCLHLNREEESDLADRLFFGAPAGPIGMLGMLPERGVPCSHGVELHLERHRSEGHADELPDGSLSALPAEAELATEVAEDRAAFETLRVGGNRDAEMLTRHPPSPFSDSEAAVGGGRGKVALAGEECLTYYLQRLTNRTSRLQATE